MQLDLRKYFFRDDTQVNLHERSSKENLFLNILVIMDGHVVVIKYKTLCIDLLFARKICCAIVLNINRTYGDLHSQVIF